MNNKQNHLSFHEKDLKIFFPKGECTISNDILIWRGTLRPSSLSKEYKIKIEYKAFESRPSVKVLSTGMRIPYIKEEIHMFDNGDLCLFYREWNPHMSIAKSIIPWTSEWLYFYEMWVVTGQWHGGSAH